MLASMLCRFLAAEILHPSQRKQLHAKSEAALLGLLLVGGTREAVSIKY
jgi:hypothetical protein